MSSNKNIEKLIEEYFANQRLMENFKQRAKEIKNVIREEMIKQGVEEIEGVYWRATWHNVSTRRLDQKSFKSSRPDIYREYTKTTTGTRFTLNEIKR